MTDWIVDLATRRPRAVFIATAVMVLLAAVQIPRIVVDTDPENMLPADQADRVFHDHAKERFALYEMIVVGLVNDASPEGVFNPASLTRLHALTRGIERIEGVIREDVLSLATVDDIGQEGPGTIRFEWMMKQPPGTQAEALAIRDAARRIPMLDGTVVSEDGRAAAIYVPIVSKTESHRIASEIEALVAELPGEDAVHVTGLPVAEDTFGVEMFQQMAISAPLAALVIFLLMWFFFRSLTLILSPMIVAMATVITVMGALIGAGFPVHIMSSMIPIFLMPIAVVDSVHILSEFADYYPEERDARATIRRVMHHLFTPMLYTSVTSAVGFASLALTPIPPVRVFGAFVALGILLAFVLTIVFVPAYAVSLAPKRLEALAGGEVDSGAGRLAAAVRALGIGSQRFAKPLVALTLVVLALSAYGISTIRINDNPVRWFTEDHRIRVADESLNEHFGGTYMAYLVMEPEQGEADRRAFEARVEGILAGAPPGVASGWQEVLAEATVEAEAAGGRTAGGKDRGAAETAGGTSDDHGAESSEGAPDFDRQLFALVPLVEERLFDASPAAEPAWGDLALAIEETTAARRLFLDPRNLAAIAALQADLQESGLVGKSNSLAQIVKTVHRELREGKPAFYSIPDSRGGVAQTLLSYESSHRPHDLWHMVTPDYRQANVWLQLKSGDNQDMERVIARVDAYLAANPLPEGLRLRWAGLTYINVVWQDAMVAGMVRSLLGSFVIVFVIMMVLFRSVLFGALAMVPLTVTIAFIYGLIGLIGKDYDMPVAVLSSLTLGLSIDFAIHFLQRARALHAERGEWAATCRGMFEEPARAITRNAIVIAVGFLPLLAAPLVPYNTVGFFMAAIMAVSSLVTMALLPSVLSLGPGLFFRAKGGEPAAAGAAEHAESVEVSS